MNAYEIELAMSAVAKLKEPQRITYRRNHPEAEVETGIVDHIAHNGRCKTFCVIPDDDKVIATIRKSETAEKARPSVQLTHPPVTPVLLLSAEKLTSSAV